MIGQQRVLDLVKTRAPCLWQMQQSDIFFASTYGKLVLSFLPCGKRSLFLPNKLNYKLQKFSSPVAEV